MGRLWGLVLFLALAWAQVHVVAPGETLFAIAKRYGTTVEVLARTNGLKDPNRIRVGQRLWVRPFLEFPLPRGKALVAPPVQGKAFGLRVEGYREGYAEFLGVRAPLFSQGGVLWGLLPVPALAEPKASPLRLLLEGEEVPLSLPVAPGGYGQEALALSPGLKALLQDPALKAEREKVVAACPREGPMPLGLAFRPPLSGRTTSPFGVRRRYGGLFTSYHEGLDYAVSPGTPVRAVADGVVVLSERLKVRGEAVVVAHGAGLCTGYWHLEARKVRPGDRVRAGQVLGLSGSTGLSTGPHLHLEVRLFGVPVDPGPFFVGLPLP
ncbi:Murein DD-endopeptidase MepM and murein hydrolase activator NlpD, contain LysM domain [Thermus arciformis]|uniref:Murein DD-endopeptidase MepM and murein hydrolase activator NlpD, contain LysM domain n=1 Tax=Thermus arciformis TaxID=482827 RepID=A0A1G7FKF2_9DEIN|nr:M23 family metallopeptidase [Thermus arciformis]SDE76310.1 Murein DD-endopeptidase MepM and murein hydrolase activator NlpD, contain LysM domain [Thermus arciformis]